MLGYDRVQAGERIRKKREALGLSQEELAEMIDRGGRFFGDIERGAKGMSVETIINISEILHMSIDYMLLGKDAQSEDGETEEVHVIMDIYEICPENKRERLIELMKLFATSFG